MKNRVKRLLASDIKYRKSDYALMTRIWYDDLKAIHYGSIEKITAVGFLNHLKNGDLSKWETVTRIRRKLQQQFKALRDENTYKGRKEEATKWKHRFSPTNEVNWGDE